MKTSLEVVREKIENKRIELSSTFNSLENLRHKEVLKKSQELDCLILEFYKESRKS